MCFPEASSKQEAIVPWYGLQVVPILTSGRQLGGKVSAWDRMVEPCRGRFPGNCGKNPTDESEGGYKGPPPEAADLM